MVDTKISGLTAAAAAALANEHAINEAGASKKVTQQQILDSVGLLADSAALADANKILVIQSSVAKDAALTALVTYLQTKGMPRVKKLTAVHSISSTTATELTDLRMSLEAGTYTFDYYLMVRSDTTSVGPMVGVNFATGTAAVKTMLAFWADASASLLAETHIMDDEGVKGTGFISGLASKTYTTTAPLLGTTVGVIATGVVIPMRITGVLVVTVAGELALWHSSETNTQTHVDAGSSLVVVRTA